MPASVRRCPLPSLLALLLAWSAWGQDVREPFSSKPKWTPLFHGVDHAELSADTPRRMRGHAVRIDLTADGVRLLATPPMKDHPNRTAGLKTSSFLAAHRCQVAINGSSFTPIHAAEGKQQAIDGLHVSDGRVVSTGNGKYDALLLGKDNKARIASPPFDLRGVWTAVGGFQVVLRDGKVPEKMPNYNRGPVHPRSAAGVSADGRTLYLLAIDGRQPAWSQGASLEDVGRWLKGLGAAHGINLDGGGTTTLVVAGADGKPRVLNRPAHGKGGAERVSGSHLGVFARPLKKTGG